MGPRIDGNCGMVLASNPLNSQLIRIDTETMYIYIYRYYMYTPGMVLSMTNLRLGLATK